MKRYLVLAIAAVLSVCAFAQDLSSYLKDSYDGFVLVNVNGQVTGPVPASVKINKDASGNSIQFVLKNFVLPNDDDPENPMYVGNIKLEEVALGFDKEEELVTLAYNKGTEIEEGDPEVDAPFWVGPNLGELPIVLKGVAMYSYVDIDIDIDAMETLGQIIHVDFYAGNDTQLEGTTNTTISGLPCEPVKSVVTVNEHMNYEMDIIMNDFSIDVPFMGQMELGDVLLPGIQVNPQDGSFEQSLTLSGMPATIKGNYNGVVLQFVCDIDASSMGMMIHTEFVSIPVVERGDVNGDGSVDVKDANAVIDSYLGNNPQPFDAEAADVNGDGHITIGDANGILNMNK